MNVRASAANYNCPQHDIDVACAQEAFRRYSAQMGASAANGGRGSASHRSICQIRAVMRDICRWLIKTGPLATMSPGQRKAVMNCIEPEFVERVRAHCLTKSVNVTALPKRPPHRMHELETEGDPTP